MKPSIELGARDKPLIEQTLGDFLDGAASRFGSREALVSVFENRRFTYAGLLDEVNRCARGLMATGAQKGDRVGIWSTNSSEWTITQLATAKMGAILVCINPAYRLHELKYALQQSGCNYLVSGEGFKDADYAKMLTELMPEIADAGIETELKSSQFPQLRHVIFLVGTDRRAVRSATARPAVAPYHQHNPGISWDDLMNLADRTTPAELAARQASLDLHDVINIQYTSGTTGFPKGAMLTHHGLLNNAHAVGVRMKLRPDDRLCIPVPFYHCFGMVMGNLTCLAHGATMVLPAPHFSPLATLKAITQEKCTAVHGVPTMFIAQLDHPQFREFDLSSLRTGIMAGAPCPIEVMRRVISEMHCPEITIACGMTETSPVCNMTETDDPIELRVGTVGRVMPHQEQKIVDPTTGQILPRGEAGELCYRGYNVMRGYYGNPKETSATIDAEGWLHGGDLAVMDERGYVRITGRLKDMICRGGEKIFPREVEEFLFTHPDIAEAYVVGIPDKYYGEQVIAWVKLKEGKAMTEDDVKHFCKGQIMNYKIPTRVKFVTEFPSTVTGKIQKFRMREISMSEMRMDGKLHDDPDGNAP